MTIFWISNKDKTAEAAESLVYFQRKEYLHIISKMFLINVPDMRGSGDRWIQAETWDTLVTSAHLPTALAEASAHVPLSHVVVLHWTFAALVTIGRLCCHGAAPFHHSLPHLWQHPADAPDSQYVNPASQLMDSASLFASCQDWI